MADRSPTRDHGRSPAPFTVASEIGGRIRVIGHFTRRADAESAYRQAVETDTHSCVVLMDVRKPDGKRVLRRRDR